MLATTLYTSLVTRSYGGRRLRGDDVLQVRESSGATSWKLRSALMSGDCDRAVRATRECLDAGMSHESVVVDVLLRAQGELSDLHATGGLELLQLRHATTILLQCLSEAKRATKVRADHKARACVMCVEGDDDRLHGQAISDLLECDGWDSSFLGTDLPHWSVSKHCRHGLYRAVVVSASRHELAGELARMVTAIGRLPVASVLVVVGASVTSGRDARWPLAEPAQSPREVVDLCRRQLDEHGARCATQIVADRIAARARVRMTELGLTIEDVSSTTGLQPGYLQSFLDARVNIDLDTLTLVASVLGIQLRDLFD